MFTAVENLNEASIRFRGNNEFRIQRDFSRRNSRKGPHSDEEFDNVSEYSANQEYMGGSQIVRDA